MTSLLHAVTTLAVLGLSLAITTVAARHDADHSGLEDVRLAAHSVTQVAGRLATEPTATAWVELGQAHTRLLAAEQAALDGPAATLSDAAELDRLVESMLAERYERLAQTVEAGVLADLASADAAPQERLDARTSLDAPLAAYLRTLDQVVIRTDRAREAWIGGESRTVSVLMLLALVLTALGLAGAGVFLMGFWKALNGDIRSLAEFGGKIARGEYPDGHLPDREDALGDLGRSLQRLTRLEKALFDVKDLSVSFQGSSHHIADQVAIAVSRSTSQGARIEGAVKMLDEIVQAIQSVYTNARRSLETAEESGREIQTSIEKLLQGAADVRQLEELTNRIEEIVSLISSIADQTDILSLNAGIEAARAGSYGRGFTVVASEVRKLADRSGRSALEISELTQSILGTVQKIAARTNEESLVMSSIQNGLGRIISAVGEVTKVSQSARDNIEGLSRAIDELTGGIGDAQREAAALSKTVGGLKTDVEKLRGLGADIGFAVSTASFAAWAVDEPLEAASEPETTRVSESPVAAPETRPGTATAAAEADRAPVEPSPAAAPPPAVSAAAPVDEELLDDLETVD